jgi:hypothetical protein
VATVVRQWPLLRCNVATVERRDGTAALSTATVVSAVATGEVYCGHH